MCGGYDNTVAPKPVRMQDNGRFRYWGPTSTDINQNRNGKHFTLVVDRPRSTSGTGRSIDITKAQAKEMIEALLEFVYSN